LAALSLNALAALAGDLVSDFFPLKNEKLAASKKRVAAYKENPANFFTSNYVGQG